MTKAKYKSVRLLIQAVNETMGEVRKVAMGNVGLPWSALNDLRDLVEQLAEKAERIAVEDVNLDNMSPGDYVATMKPLVSVFHRQLMEANHLAPVLCADLRANACVLILVGEGNTVVRAAHDPSRPEITLAVEAILAALDSGTKKVVEDGAAAVETMSVEYWKEGTRLIEECLAKARRADPADAPIPLVGDDAKMWHAAQAAAYQHALEMMGLPTPQEPVPTQERVASAFDGIDQQVGVPIEHNTTSLTVENLEAGVEEILRDPEMEDEDG